MDLFQCPTCPRPGRGLGGRGAGHRRREGEVRREEESCYCDGQVQDCRESSSLWESSRLSSARYWYWGSKVKWKIKLSLLLNQWNAKLCPMIKFSTFLFLYISVFFLWMGFSCERCERQLPDFLRPPDWYTMSAGKESLGYSEDEEVYAVLEEDGTEVDEEEYFQLIPHRTCLIVMSRKEFWSPVDTWTGAGDESPSPSLSSENLAAALIQHLVKVQVEKCISARRLSSVFCTLQCRLNTLQPFYLVLHIYLLNIGNLEMEKLRDWHPQGKIYNFSERRSPKSGGLCWGEVLEHSRHPR